MRVLLITAAIVALDQITKVLVKGFSIFGYTHEGMRYADSIPVLGDWFNITYIENPNMAFGLEFGGKYFLSLFALAAAIGIIVYLYINRSKPYGLRLSLALIVAGAIGNLIDRAMHAVVYGTGGWFEGNVVDFIDFDLFVIHFGQEAFKFWPIFNVADMAVSIGVGLLLIYSGKTQAIESEAETAATVPAEGSDTQTAPDEDDRERASAV